MRLSIAGIAFLAVYQPCWASPDGHLISQADVDLREELAFAGGRTPRLSSSDDGLLLSWQQVSGKAAQLNYTRLNGDQFDRPRTVVSGENWFVNYADYASVSDLGNGHWMASWLVKSKHGLPAYYFKIAQSFDYGRHWSAATTPFSAEPDGQQGFVCAISVDDGVLLSWIGANDENYAHYSSRLDRYGNWSPITMIDEDNCSCCHPDMAKIGGKTAVVYRDRTSQNVRDIAISFEENGQWSEPRIVATDSWQINGCPVNGPALVSLGEAYAVAWFSAPKGESKVQLKAVTTDGRSLVFLLDGEESIGYVDAVGIDTESVLVAWLSGGKNLQLNLQHVDLRELRLGVKRILPLPDVRPGFPSLAVNSDRLWIAYESVDGVVKLLSADITAWIGL